VEITNRVFAMSLSDPRALLQLHVTEQTGYLSTRILLLEIKHKELTFLYRRLLLFSRAKNSFLSVDRKYFEKVNEEITSINYYNRRILHF